MYNQLQIFVHDTSWIERQLSVRHSDSVTQSDLLLNTGAPVTS